jgi:hypothetical protein
MAADEFDLYVEADGDVQFVHDDRIAEALAGAGETETERASHVEPAATWCPVHHGRRDARCYAEGCPPRGNGWIADLYPVAGPLLGPFATRTAALEAELEWLGGQLGGDGLRRPTAPRGGPTGVTGNDGRAEFPAEGGVGDGDGQ